MRYQFIVFGSTAKAKVYDWCPEEPCTKTGHAAGIHEWSTGKVKVKGSDFPEYWGSVVFKTYEEAVGWLNNPSPLESGESQVFKDTFDDIHILRAVTK